MGTVDSYQVGNVRERERDGDYRIPGTALSSSFSALVHPEMLLGQL